MIAAFDGKAPRIAATAFVHERATVIGDVELGDDCSIWPGAVLRGDFGYIRVGARTSIQDNAVIHTSPQRGTEIGSDCLIAHLAFIEAAEIGDACMVAVGAVLHSARMQPGSVAAAGTVLVGDVEVPSGHRAQGVPAKIVPISNPTRASIEDSAGKYVAMARRYLAELPSAET
jgi:carbonic anhydrase/acetyltransferase-like protein (isoleucine patch superfamily)